MNAQIHDQQAKIHKFEKEIVRVKDEMETLTAQFNHKLALKDQEMGKLKADSEHEYQALSHERDSIKSQLHNEQKIAE